MTRFMAWLCIFHHIPDSGDERLPLFFEAEYRLIAPVCGCVMGALLSLLLAGPITMLLPGVGGYWMLLLLAGGLALLAILLIGQLHRMLASTIDDSHYQWCLAHHASLGLPAPSRGMDKKQLGRYVEAMYIEEARARWARVHGAAALGKHYRSLDVTQAPLSGGCESVPLSGTP